MKPIPPGVRYSMRPCYQTRARSCACHCPTAHAPRSHYGNTFAAAHQDGTLAAWDRRSGRLVAKVRPAPRLGVFSNLAAHAGFDGRRGRAARRPGSAPPSPLARPAPSPVTPPSPGSRPPPPPQMCTESAARCVKFARGPVDLLAASEHEDQVGDRGGRGGGALANLGSRQLPGAGGTHRYKLVGASLRPASTRTRWGDAGRIAAQGGRRVGRAVGSEGSNPGGLAVSSLWRQYSTRRGLAVSSVVRSRLYPPAPSSRAGAPHRQPPLVVVRRPPVQTRYHRLGTRLNHPCF